MAKSAPRPRLRDGVGQGKTGRSGEFEGDPVDLVGYDLPFELAGPGRMQWLQFSADPMSWWTEADLPTVAQYCAALDAMKAAKGGKVCAWAAASKEVRALADALGLTPMARARMGLRKPPGGSGSGDSGGGGPGAGGKGGTPAKVIPIGELVEDQ